MRRLLAAALFALVLTPAASAQQCAPVRAEEFVESGVASINSGELKGSYLRGTQAVAFANDAGITVDVLAVFILEQGDDTLMLLVARTAEGLEVACFGAPNEASKAAIRKHIQPRA
jgi:hypothetical protein